MTRKISSSSATWLGPSLGGAAGLRLGEVVTEPDDPDVDAPVPALDDRPRGVAQVPDG
jgi:hypothetical protein